MAIPMPIVCAVDSIPRIFFRVPTIYPIIYPHIALLIHQTAGYRAEASTINSFIDNTSGRILEKGHIYRDHSSSNSLYSV